MIITRYQLLRDVSDLNLIYETESVQSVNIFTTQLLLLDIFPCRSALTSTQHWCAEFF